MMAHAKGLADRPRLVVVGDTQVFAVALVFSDLDIWSSNFPAWGWSAVESIRIILFEIRRTIHTKAATNDCASRLNPISVRHAEAPSSQRTVLKNVGFSGPPTPSLASIEPVNE